jgi:hypothetical protein
MTVPTEDAGSGADEAAPIVEPPIEVPSFQPDTSLVDYVKKSLDPDGLETRDGGR